MALAWLSIDRKFPLPSAWKTTTRAKPSILSPPNWAGAARFWRLQYLQGDALRLLGLLDLELFGRALRGFREALPGGHRQRSLWILRRILAHVAHDALFDAFDLCIGHRPADRLIDGINALGFHSVLKGST